MEEFQTRQLTGLARQVHERVANQTVTALAQSAKSLDQIVQTTRRPKIQNSGISGTHASTGTRPAGWHFFQTRIWALTLDVNRLRQAETMLRQHPQGKLILEMRQYKLLEHNAMRALDDVSDYIGDDAFDNYVQRAQVELNKVFDFMRQQTGAPGAAVES